MELEELLERQNQDEQQKETTENEWEKPDDFEAEKNLSKTEAVQKLNDLQEDYATAKDTMLKIRWEQGAIAAHVDTKYGEGTIKKIANEIDLHPNTLRECIRLYEFFHGNYELYQEWLEEDDRKWYDVQGLIRSNSDPRVLGPDALKGRIIRRLERTSEDLEKITEHVQKGDVEARGVLNRTVDEVAHFGAHGVKAFESRTGDIPRSENYLDFIREQECYLTGTTKDVQAHHVKMGGKGIKGSDFLAVPLCHDKHREYHQLGRKTFESKYDVDMRHICLEYLHLYISEQGAFEEI